MKTHTILTSLALALAFVVQSLNAATEPARLHDEQVEARLKEAIAAIFQNPKTRSLRSPLLLLFKNEQVAEANQMILDYCRRPLSGRPEDLFRTYLLEQTHRLLSPQARAAIEDYAWNVLTKSTLGITPADADKSFFLFEGAPRAGNGYNNDRRRYTLALQIVRMSARYGPKTMLSGQTVEANYQAWVRYWLRYFRDLAAEGPDTEVAHRRAYGSSTVGSFYDIHDLTDNAELRKLAGKFLTLYWAEVAGEFQPRNGERAWAATRQPAYYADGYWAAGLLHCYGWDDLADQNLPLSLVPFVTSSYRPPAILSAIARDPNRGCYLATSRRAAMLIKANGKEVIGFDAKGDSHFRRDVFYTLDYTLSTMTLDPTCDYEVTISLAQTMGVTFASEKQARITVCGTGYYCFRAVNGMTGTNVSIIARDPKAEFGLDRFKSNGNRVFISNHGELWTNRVEDASGWFFSRCGNAYVALRVAGNGYHITDKSYEWPNRKLKEIKEARGHFLELKDMWAPVVIQMGRAADYKSFEAFQSAVKARKFEYENGKLTYESEAKDKYEYWAKGAQLPKINGSMVNLNPAKTYDSPFLFMVHGEGRAVISYSGFPNLELDFGTKKN